MTQSAVSNCDPIWSQLLKKSLIFLGSDDNVMHGIINNQLKKISYFKNTAVEGTQNKHNSARHLIIFRVVEISQILEQSP